MLTYIKASNKRKPAHMREMFPFLAVLLNYYLQEVFFLKKRSIKNVIFHLQSEVVQTILLLKTVDITLPPSNSPFNHKAEQFCHKIGKLNIEFFFLIQ